MQCEQQNCMTSSPALSPPLSTISIASAAIFNYFTANWKRNGKKSKGGKKGGKGEGEGRGEESRGGENGRGEVEEKQGETILCPQNEGRGRR